MILLTFDDCRPAEWAAIIPDMKRLGIRATFYVSNLATISPVTGWAQLHRLNDEGHSIQYHGLNHVNAGKVTDWEQYIKEEIVAGMEILFRHGFNPQHFAYPFGHYTEESHRQLAGFFVSLRTLYAVNPMPYERIWGAFDWDSRRYEAAVSQPVEPGGITPIVMHRPDVARLEGLLETRGDAFVTVTDVKWPK